MINDEFVELAKKAALEAGSEILKIYAAGGFSVEAKSDDSPLTIADKTAHNIIEKHLQSLGLPILSEEGRLIPFSERSLWTEFWMVDPLDGTKEFIKKNGEFTVNIAYIQNGKPLFGVVYAPVLDKLYYSNSQGAFCHHAGNTIQLETKKAGEVKTILASRSHRSPETEAFIKDFPKASAVSMGSSLKFLLLAENKAQIYPRFAPTMEWDTAAAHGIIHVLGYRIKTIEGEELIYNKENLLNPFFIAQ
tara:strand:- start:176537 stop:177280 length:744 start_codon:yes stop_codon:yes gene_type:complete